MGVVPVRMRGCLSTEWGFEKQHRWRASCPRLPGGLTPALPCWPLFARSHKTERWLPCHVETGGAVAELKDQNGTVYTEVPAKECYPMHESSLEPVANLVELGDLNEAAILHNLRVRYRECVAVRFCAPRPPPAAAKPDTGA